MIFSFKKVLFAAFLFFGMLMTTDAVAQSACCSKAKATKTTACCSSSSASNAKTSGCSPSACRGEQTKFGEAKVITSLRNELIALKADMETSDRPSFDARSYDIHGIVGETDNESLEIIVREVQLIERSFTAKLNHPFASFNLPGNKAKQVQYLNGRIETLQRLL